MIIRNRENAGWTSETDIVIIGAGGCGLVAALAASEYDVDVLVLESESEVGGNTVLSTGGIKGAGTESQHEAGINDGPEKYARDIISQNEGRGDRQLIQVITTESPRTIDWLIRDIGVELRINPGPPIPGHSVRRTHWPVDKDGNLTRTCEPVLDHISTVVANRGVTIRTEVRAEQLVVDDDDTVVGVATEADRKPLGRSEREIIKAKTVLIASNGFGANHEMRSEYIPETVDMVYWGANGSTGDAIRWGEKLGAAIDNTSSYLTFPTVSQPDELWLPGELITEGAVILNENGERFGDVGNQPYPEFAVKMQAQPGNIGYEIFDQRIYDVVSSSTLSKERFTNAVDNDVFASADSIETLADKLGLNSTDVKRTITRVNSCVEENTAIEFGRRVKNTLSPPFYGSKVAPCIAETQGGIRVNERAQVLREDGTPIGNLFAGGSATVGITGSEPEGYLPGNGLLTAINLGKIMGETAAQQIE